MTPGLEFTRRRADEAAPGAASPGTASPGTASPSTVAADLGEIRRAEQALDLAAARALVPAELRDDPALALLTALAADVDAQGAGVKHNWPAHRAAPSRGLAGWLRAAVAGVVVAGLAGTTSLIAASMLARLTRGAGTRGRTARPRRLR